MGDVREKIIYRFHRNIQSSLPLGLRSVGQKYCTPYYDNTYPPLRIIPFYEILWVTRGEIFVMQKGAYSHVKTGMAVIIPCGGEVAYKTGKYPCDYWMLTFDGGASMAIMQELNFSIERPLRVDAFPEKMYLELIESLKSPSPDEEYTSSLLLYDFLLHLKRSVRREEVKRLNLDVSRIERAISIINDKFSDPNFCVNELSESIGVTRTTLWRHFKLSIGTTPTEYLHTRRMREVLDMLKHTKLSNREIAHRCGFKDANYFGKFFRKTVGVSPSEFRRVVSEYSCGISDG